MIIVRLMGGLGNQMFQYAAGKSLAARLGCELKLDVSFLNGNNPDYTHTHREFDLDVFKLESFTASEKEMKSFLQWEERRRYRIVKRVFPFISERKIFREKHFHFNEEFSRLNDNTLLIGFWQSWKYFSKISAQLRKDFEFRNETSGNNNKIKDKILSSNSISLHVRRGDYVNNPETAKYHPTCSVDYYQHAVEHIAKHVESPVLFLFSDDIEWTKENLRFTFPVEIVSGNNGKNSFEDMRLMSLCKHNIIANSSFSWWSAWLNRNQGKKIVAPVKWFSDSSIDTKDLIPGEWLLM